MKRLTSLFICAALLFAMIPLAVVPSTAETSGDYEYSILADGTAEITKYIGSATTLEIPSSLDGYTVTGIGYNAFWYCTSLERVTIPNSVISIGEWAFSYCESLECITIPNGVTDIGAMAFWECTSLERVTIPNSVISIGRDAFACTSLTEISIPNSVTMIDHGTFYDCTKLERVTISDSVTSISGYAFFGCTSLRDITLPDSVTSIGDDAFSNCTSLKRITVDSNNAYFSSDNGVLYNKIKTELLCYPAGKTKTSFSIPNSVTGIGDRAFDGCKNLKRVTIPDSVTSIGKWAFNGCTSLKRVAIPNSVTSIGDCAFLDCESLTDITIPDSVTDIGDSAFGIDFDYVNEDYDKIKNFTVSGYTDTAAQRYAKKYRFRFIDLGPAPGRPAKVSGVNVKAGKKKVTVTWKKAKNAKKYAVKYSYKKNMKSAKTVTAKKLKVTLKKLKSGKKIYIQVRGVNGKKYGTWSAKKSIKVK